jgi:serine/threonine-protein kinase
MQSLYLSIDRYITASKDPTDKIDLALGKSGLLIGFAILQKDIRAIKNFDGNILVPAANRIMNELWISLDQYAAIDEKNEIDYFGIAHGWAGILYATLSWCLTSGQPLPEQFLRRVGQLHSSMLENEFMSWWPLTVDDARPWTGWCNGSAGHTFLWTLLYRYFKEEKYLDIAKSTAQHLLQDTRAKIYNLCCGMSGHAYALLCLYNLTQEKKYIGHVMNLKNRILDNLSFPSERINSLYKSMPGAAVFLCELERPELARMPLFE